MTKPALNDEPSITVPVAGADGRVQHRQIPVSDLEQALEHGRYREGGNTARLVTDARGRKVLAL